MGGICQRVGIEIVNTDAQWFVPFGYINPVNRRGILDIFERVRDESGELLRTLRGRQSAGEVLITFTDWKKEFGMEMLHLMRLSRNYRGGFPEFNREVEITLWYADKYGDGMPDYLSFGKSKGEGVIVNGDGVIVSKKEARSLVDLVKSCPKGSRIARPENHILYVENVILTPRPEVAREPPKGTVVNGYLTNYGEMDCGPIDILGLYEGLNKFYSEIRGSDAKAIDYEKLPPLTRLQINLVLNKIGYRTQPLRNAVLAILLDTRYLEGNEQLGYSPTSRGVSDWHLDKKHGVLENRTYRCTLRIQNLPDGSLSQRLLEG